MFFFTFSMQVLFFICILCFCFKQITIPEERWKAVTCNFYFFYLNLFSFCSILFILYSLNLNIFVSLGFSYLEIVKKLWIQIENCLWYINFWIMLNFSNILLFPYSKHNLHTKNAIKEIFFKHISLQNFKSLI